MDEIWTASGRRVVRVDLNREERPSDAELLKLLIGPSGKLRAPTVRRGRALVVGFDEAAYERLVG